MLHNIKYNAMASERKLRRRCFGGQRNEDFEPNVHMLHVDAGCLPLTASFRREAGSSRLTSGWSPPPGDLSLMRGHVGRKLGFLASGDRER